MSLATFNLIIYFCFLYLAASIVFTTIWVLRDRNKLKRKSQNHSDSSTAIKWRAAK